MAQYAHKGEILPLANQMIPIDKETTLHASYDYHLNGMNRRETIFPMGPERCFDFNGTNSMVTPGKIFESTPSAVTVEVWFNARALNGYPTIIDFGVPGNAFYMEQYSTNQLMIGGYVGTGGTNFSGLTNEVRVPYTLNTWTHVAYTATSTDLRVYVNGVIAGNFPASYNLSMFTNPATIGGGRNLFNGMIADMRVWNFAKPEGQIKEDMYKTFSGGETGLVAYWKLNEREGSIAYDASGNGRDGVISGTIARATTGMTVATIRKEEGKFRGAVLIEPDTTNIVSTVTSAEGMDTTTPAPVPPPILGQTVYHIAAGDWKGIALTPNPRSYTATSLFSISLYVYIKRKTLARFNLPMDSTETNNYALGNINLDTRVSGPGWYKIEINSLSRAEAHTNVIFRIENYWSGDTGTYADWASDNECWMTAPQVEYRPKATSFTPYQTSRSVGKLWYPGNLINPSAFTVSCWFKIPRVHTVSNSNTGIQGNWYHPIIEVAPTSNIGDTTYSICVEPNTGAGYRKIRYRMPNVTGSKTIEDDTWYHLIATWDGTTHKLYIDGVQNISTTAAHGSLNNTVLMVGGGYYGKPLIMIDELRIESRAISADEAEAWAASGLHYNYLDYSTYVD